MTQPDTFRRATEAEIATAHAWVDRVFTGADSTENERQTEYETALEIIIFANGGRHTTPTHRIEQAITDHYVKCKLSHPTNVDWFACEARTIAGTPAP